MQSVESLDWVGPDPGDPGGTMCCHGNTTQGDGQIALWKTWVCVCMSECVMRRWMS